MSRDVLVFIESRGAQVKRSSLEALSQGRRMADGLGSTMAMVDSTGVIQKSYQYDVYGEVGAAAGITVVALWAGSASLSRLTASRA